MTKEQIKALLKITHAIHSLEIEQSKQWNYVLIGEDLSKIQFVKDDGTGYSIPDSKPSDFPTDSAINARITAMHNLVDAGKTFTEVMATTSW